MPGGPEGEKRPADVIGNAVHVMRIATGEIEETGRDIGTEANRKRGLKATYAKQRRHEGKERAAMPTSRWRRTDCLCSRGILWGVVKSVQAPSAPALLLWTPCRMPQDLYE